MLAQRLADELRRRCEAICRLQGGHTYYGEEVAVFCEFAEEKGLFLEEVPRFEEAGWKPFLIGSDLAFFDPQTRIAVSDTHPGNLILMADGNFAPIDLRVQQLTPVLAEAVMNTV